VILAFEDSKLAGYHYRVTESFERQIALDDYGKALDALPPLAERKAEEVQAEVKRWIDGPQTTGLNLAGEWKTTFTWGEGESATDTLRVSNGGDFVVDETVRSGKWDYTLSGRFRGIF
jgi:hypothetical protein